MINPVKSHTWPSVMAIVGKQSDYVQKPIQVHTILRSENCNFSTWKILFLFLLFFAR